MSLLGVDIGTTGIRASVFDARGTPIAEASEPCPPHMPAPGRAEADASSWWAATCALCARLGRQTALARVEAVGVTGQAPTAILVDGNGQPLRPAILWLDTRARDEARAIETALGPARAAAIGGNRMHTYFLGPKLAWLRAHEPEALDRAQFVLQSHAFVVMQLTGEPTCDESTAMLCAPLFDVSSRAWSQEGARAAGVPTRLLPRLARAHDVVGTVTHRAAAATGLRPGTPVVGGGGDFAASALFAGVVEEGQACLMLGTSGNLLMPTRRPGSDTRLIGSHHVGCDRWLSLGGTLCGAALEWFRRTCAPDATWHELEREAAAVAPAEGLLVLPFLQGERTPFWDDQVRGVFFGLDLTHRRGHLYRALLEGIALGFRACLTVGEEQGIAFHEVVAVSGAGESALLRQALADALGLPVEWSPSGASAETVAGAAMLAGLGVGALAGAGAERGAQGAQDSASSTSSWRSRERSICLRPDPRAHERLTKLLARRTSLYEACRRV